MGTVVLFLVILMRIVGEGCSRVGVTMVKILVGCGFVRGRCTHKVSGLSNSYCIACNSNLQMLFKDLYLFANLSIIDHRVEFSRHLVYRNRFIRKFDSSILNSIKFSALSISSLSFNEFNKTQFVDCRHDYNYLLLII